MLKAQSVETHTKYYKKSKYGHLSDRVDFCPVEPNIFGAFGKMARADFDECNKGTEHG